MKRVAYLSFFVLLALSFLIWAGCGSSQKTVNKGESTSTEEAPQDDYDEIEKLLGISRDEKTESDTEGKGTEKGKDDDLIKLLEVDESKNKASAQEKSSASNQGQATNLKQKINKLQKETRKKDMEIADLKAQLRMLKNQSSNESSFQSMGRSAASSAGSYNAPPSYVSKYERGLKIFHDRKYREALEVFEQLLATDTNNDYSDNAQYWIGECYYALGHYQEAIMAFEKVFTFKFSNKNDYAQFKIGQCYFMIGNQARAEQEFQQFLDNYPESQLNQRAREYLAQL